VPDIEIPKTHSGQLTQLLAIIGGTDFSSAQAAITQMQAWNNQRATLFAALGGTGDVPADFNFVGAINALNNERQGLFTALGVTDGPAALTRIREVVTHSGNWSALVAELGTKEAPITDLAGATAAIAGLRTAVTDFEGKVSTEVTKRIASAGVQQPLPKVPADKTGEGVANSMARADWQVLGDNAKAEFFRKGGVLTD
jgi:hypothetical protein